MKRKITQNEVLKRTGKANFYGYQELELVEGILRLSSTRHPITARTILRQAYVYCEENNIKHHFCKQALSGMAWITKFLKRYPEVADVKQPIMNKSNKVTQADIKVYFEDLSRLYVEHDIHNHPERVYCMNVEKFHFASWPHERFFYAQIVRCVNAAGLTIPPIIIFKTPAEHSYFHEIVPEGAVMVVIEEFGIGSPLVSTIIKHLGKHKAPGKCLLILSLDGLAFDYDTVDAAEQLGIKMRVLPANSKAELKPFDSYVYRTCRVGRKMARFVVDFIEAWRVCLYSEEIVEAFEKKGLFPLNPSKMLT